jgi:hypothetical protein
MIDYSAFLHQILNIVQHCTDFLRCPHHSLASVAALDETLTDRIFSNSQVEASFQNEVDVVWNALMAQGNVDPVSGAPLCRLRDGNSHTFTKDLTSKSARVALATDLMNDTTVRTRYVGSS